MSNTERLIKSMRNQHGGKAILLIKEDDVRAYTTNCYGAKSLGSWLACGFKLEGQYRRDIAKRRQRLNSTTNIAYRSLNL